MAAQFATMGRLCFSLAVLLHAAALAEGRPDAGATAPDAGVVAPDAEARFLAGLAQDGGVLARQEQAAAWRAHAAELQKAWTTLEIKRLAPMRAWAKAELWPRVDTRRPLIYFFGGPDVISADVLYPEAPTLVLMGLERPGAAVALPSLSAAELDASLASLRATIRTTVSVSYFITSQMGADLNKSAFKGVLPVLLFFLARNGEQVVQVDAVTLDATGQVVTLPAPPAEGLGGWRLRFRRSEAAPLRQLFYLRLDLIDPVAEKAPGLFRFLEGLGPVNAYLKAASFILHDRHFSLVRNHLLEHSASVLQDDSGLPFKFLATPKWSLTLFGSYSPPRETFKEHLQPELAKAFEKARPPALPFDTGYQHTGKGSHLVLAVRAEAPPDAGVAEPKR